MARARRDFGEQLRESLAQMGEALGQNVATDPDVSAVRRRELLQRLDVATTAQAAMVWMVRGDDQRALTALRGKGNAELMEIRLAASRLSRLAAEAMDDNL